MKAIEKILIFFKKCADDAVAAYAAFAAFFIIVSFFPFVMLLLTLLQFLPFSASDVSEYIGVMLPPSVVTTLNPIITELYETGTGFISITAVAAVWAASKGVYALVCGLNSVYGVKETRNLIAVRILSIFYTIVFLFMIVVSIGALMFGGRLFRFLESAFPWMGEFTGLRYLIGLVIFIFFFLVMFRSLPNQKSTIMAELPGAIIAALGWLLFSYIYAYYIDNFSSFPVLYGSITAVVFLMLWLYFCMYITLLAAEINAMRRRNKSPFDFWETR